MKNESRKVDGKKRETRIEKKKENLNEKENVSSS